MITDTFNFYNSEMQEVTKYIKEGKTKAFKMRKDAEKHAKQKGSYVYDLLCQSVKSANAVIRVYGYGVPN